MSDRGTQPTQDSTPDPQSGKDATGSQAAGTELLGSSASEWQAESSTAEEPVPGMAQPPEPRPRLRLYNWLLIFFGLLLVLALAALFFLFFTPGGTPQATPTLPAPSATPIVDVVWADIQARGQLRAAVSTGVLPFAELNEMAQPAGLDAALLQEIGLRLGLPTALQDLAATGLPAALQVGQVDLAAGMRTPDGPSPPGVALSAPFYTRVDAYLAQRDAGVSVQSVSDLAHTRLGVVQGTDLARWVQVDLADAGQIAPEDVFLYTSSDQAAADLLAGRLDILLLDEAAASVYLADGALSLAGRGLHPQDHVLLLPTDAPQLAEQVNDALAQMQADGTLSRLLADYLGVPDSALPAVEIGGIDQPGVTPEAEACLDAMEWLTDAPPADVRLRLPGERFAYSWRVRNTGTCTWQAGYRLVPAGDAAAAVTLDGSPIGINTAVPPGETYDLRLPLTAPLTAGTYQGIWQLQSPAGVAFGARLPVDFSVSADGTPPSGTPPTIQRFSPPGLALAPEDLSLPTGTFDLPLGTCVNLQWQVRGAAAQVELQRNEQPVWSSAPLQGAYQDCPSEQGGYVYRLVAADAGSSRMQEVRVELRPEAAVPPAAPGVPQIRAFSVQPELVTPGVCVQLSWQISGEVERVRLRRDGELVLDDLPTEGSGQDCFRTRRSPAYTLEAVGAGEIVSAAAQVSAALTGNYALQQLQNSDGTLVDLLPNSAISLTLAADMLSGVGGCNDFSGAYTLTEDVLEVGALTVTTQLCPPPALMRQETRFLELLSLANRLHLLGSRLEFILQRTDPDTGGEVETVLLVLDYMP
ncbi:MAG: NBR1-Ig-like domain-containing protein [Anaerolineales bacterium]